MSKNIVIKDITKQEPNDNTEGITEDCISFPSSDRRLFFSKGLATLFTALFGLNVLKGFSQNKKGASETNDYKNKLKSLRTPKKIVSEPDTNSIDQKIQNLDKNNQLVTLKKGRILSSEELNLNKKIDQYNTVININEETGIVQIHGGGNDMLDKLNIGKIEAELDFDEEWITQNAKKYLPNKVESLLNQAADLLDRGVKDRNEWDEKSIDFLNITLELNEFQKADTLLKKQVKEGLYERDYKKAKVEYEVQKVTQMKAALAQTQMEKILAVQFSEKSFQEQQDNLRRMNKSYSFAGWHADATGPAYEHSVTFDNTQASIFEFFDNGSLASNQYNFAIQEEMYKIQLRQMESNEITSSKNKVYAKDKLEWEEKSIGYREEHDQIIRATGTYKLASYLADDGMLNYIKRLIPLKQRFKDDFLQAYTRIKAASVGLRGIYDYSIPLPSFKTNHITFFDECLIWNRNAINYINKITQNQVVGTITLSIRSLFKNYDDFKNGYYTGEWAFKIDKQLFKDKYQVKLLGLSLSIVGLSKHYREPINLDGCFSASINLPRDPLYSQLTDEDTLLDLNGYPTIPDIYLGNVSDNTSPRNPEIGGTQLITNLSPFGSWKILLAICNRPFNYIKKDNGKIRKISDSKANELDTLNSNNSFNDSDSSLNVDKLVNISQEHVRFIPTDFWDLKLNLHVAYLIK